MGTAPRLSGYKASLILSMIHEKCVPDEPIGQGETTAAWDTTRWSAPALQQVAARDRERNGCSARPS